MAYLAPIILKRSQVDRIERDIQRIIDEIIFDPIARILDDAKEYQQSLSVILDALRRDDIWYTDGAFYGAQNSAISKEMRKLGATYDARSQRWLIEQAKLPAVLKFAIEDNRSRMREKSRKVAKTLHEFNPDAMLTPKLQKSYEAIIGQFDSDFERSIDAHAAIGIAPQLTPAMTEQLARAYTQNLDKYIKDWVAEDITDLRGQVEAHALQGGRADSLKDIIRRNHGVSESKAKFLAHQETSLLLSQFRQTRYEGIGVTRYTWRGAMDQRERPDHRMLEGKVFSFKHPPVTNQKTGARNNPGEDYGCRCVAVGLVE